VWVTAQALSGLEAKPYPLRPAPRQRARTAAPAKQGVSARPGAAKAGIKSAAARSRAPANGGKSAKVRHKQARQRPARTSALGTSEPEIRTRPVAQTTTTTGGANSSKKTDDGSSWPYVFAVLLGVVMLAGIRLAWRRD
jgi:hypothetical protein